MIMQDNEKKPALRFKGFTDPWEQRKLGDISEIKTGPFGSTLHADDYVSDGIPIITTEHFKTGSLPIDKCGLPQVSENDFSRLSAYILNAGDIVFSRVGSVDINALITPFQSTWLFSGRVLRVRPQNKNSSQFLHTLLETEDVKNDIRTRAVGQTMPSINTEILKTTPLRLPESTLEQEQLGKYFLNLDTLITLHQRKHEKLVNIKKSMLDKMFPQNGVSVPEIRFKGFTDPWEQRKLGDITVELSEYATQELGLPLLTSSRSGLMYQDEYRDSRTTKSTETLFSVVPVGTCTYRHMSDDDVFHMNINTLEKGLVSREYPVFEASKGNNLEFLVQHINSSEEFKAFCAEQKKGGTRTRLYYNTLCQFTVRVPALKEQAQISQCLKKLDTLITLHQRKLEKLQNIKKSCLEKMFV